MEEKLKRWRLILGKDADEKLGALGIGAELSDEERLMDSALASIYDETSGDAGAKSSQRQAGTGKSAPNIAKWLADVRKMFPDRVVSVIQSDAIQRKGLTQLLMEPELLSTVKPDIKMVSTIMALSAKIPETAKEQARELVRAVVKDIMKRLENDLRRAVTGALNRRNHSPIPSVSTMDIKRTITRNLKHYDRERKKLIPSSFYFFERARRHKEWTVILDIDQSGSMAESIIYASVMGAIFASMPSLDTHVIAFDTEVVDLTEVCRNDPVDVLFGVQLGGGTDINKSVQYCAELINDPKKTIFILISDLYEGGVEKALITKLENLHAAGVKTLVLLSLSDSGRPAYDEHLAKKIAALVIPCFACTPDMLPPLVEAAIKGKDLNGAARG